MFCRKGVVSWVLGPREYAQMGALPHLRILAFSRKDEVEYAADIPNNQPIIQEESHENH